jgi:LPXTG-motif cell wall-anchored protein
MNWLQNARPLARRISVLGLVCVALATVAWTQTSTTQTQSGTVVYVSGNDVVVKMDDGNIRHVTAPEGATAVVDGKTITVKDLKPGMHLTRTITTTTTPRTIKNVRTVSGKVWYVAAPYVILTLPDGTNKQYKVPDGTKFNIDGSDKTVFDLRKGMNVSATIVTESTENIVTQQRSVSGTAPAAPAAAPAPPPTPAVVGVLLIEEAAPAKKVSAPTETAAAPAPAPAPAAKSEPAPKSLPKTGSPVPLIGLLGLLFTSAGLGMRALRRK